MSGLFQDLRFSLRQLLRRPGFSVLAILTLALGIGLTAAIFNLTNTVILRTSPVHKAHELVLLGEGRPMGVDVGFPNGNTELFSYPFYRELQRGNQVFSGVAAMQSLPSDVFATVESGGAEPVSDLLLLLAAGLVLGLPAALAANRLVASMLFELKATNPLSMAMALLLLIAVALFAGFLPARRAAKVDPMVALRYE